MAEWLPKPEKLGVNIFFVLLYLIVFVAVIVYPGIISGFNIESYSFSKLVSISGYIVPGFFFSIFGIMTMRSKKSLVYAISAGFISLIILIFIFQIVD